MGLDDGCGTDRGGSHREGGGQQEGGERRGRTLRLAGDWHAIWQTTADGAPNVNSEVVRVTQRGSRLTLFNLAPSPENALGGYLWRGEATLRDNHFLVGSYAAALAHVGSHGSLFFVVNRSGDYLTGKWVGCNLDSNFTWGFGVLARDKGRGADKLFALLGAERETRGAAWGANGPSRGWGAGAREDVQTTPGIPEDIGGRHE